MVGNFQETTVSSVHFIGASLCFGLGTIYIWIQVVWLAFNWQHFSASEPYGHQVYLTSFVSPPSYPGSIRVMRLVLAALDTLSLLTAAVAALVARLVSDEAEGWEGNTEHSFQKWLIIFIWKGVLLMMMVLIGTKVFKSHFKILKLNKWPGRE